GFVTNTAKSYWSTTNTTNGTKTVEFWQNSPVGTATVTYPNLPYDDLPDGEFVEKGGAAQQIRSLYLTDQTARRVYTCGLTSGSPDCAGTLTAGKLSSFAFNTTNVSGSAYQTSFGAADATELSNIVNWVRGNNNNS